MNTDVIQELLAAKNISPEAKIAYLAILAHGAPAVTTPDQLAKYLGCHTAMAEKYILALKNTKDNLGSRIDRNFHTNKAHPAAQASSTTTHTKTEPQSPDIWTPLHTPTIQSPTPTQKKKLAELSKINQRTLEIDILRSTKPPKHIDDSLWQEKFALHQEYHKIRDELINQNVELI